jgi:hypothetical protein
MGVELWIGLFVVESFFCWWIVFGNGIDTMAGIVAAVLLGADLFRWSESGIRVFVGLTWIVLAFWFVVGLALPEARFVR